MGKVILKGYIEVPEADLKAVQSELETHTRLTLNEPGCFIFKVTQRLDDPLCFDVYEEFVDRHSFEQHQKRVQDSHWGAITKQVKRTYEIIE